MSRKIAITISPPPRYVKYLNPNRVLYDDDKNNIIRILNYNKIYRYIIYPEFDEKGRLHYHGILNLNHTEYTRFLKHAIYKLAKIGFIDITDCSVFKNNLRQVVYMSKTWLLTKDVLEINEPIMSKRQKRLKPKAIKELDKILNTLDNWLIPC